MLWTVRLYGLDERNSVQSLCHDGFIIRNLQLCFAFLYLYNYFTPTILLSYTGFSPLKFNYNYSQYVDSVLNIEVISESDN